MRALAGLPSAQGLPKARLPRVIPHARARVVAATPSGHSRPYTENEIHDPPTLRRRSSRLCSARARPNFLGARAPRRCRLRVKSESTIKLRDSPLFPCVLAFVASAHPCATLSRRQLSLGRVAEGGGTSLRARGSEAWAGCVCLVWPCLIHSLPHPRQAALKPTTGGLLPQHGPRSSERRGALADGRPGGRLVLCGWGGITVRD